MLPGRSSRVCSFTVSPRFCGGEIFPTGKATDTNRWSSSRGHTRSRTVLLQKILHSKGRERRQSRLGRNRRRSASRGVPWRVPACCEKLGDCLGAIDANL